MMMSKVNSVNIIVIVVIFRDSLFWNKSSYFLDYNFHFNIVLLLLFLNYNFQYIFVTTLY